MRWSAAVLGMSGTSVTPLSPSDERQTKSGPLLVSPENATTRALFQPSGDEAQRITANVAKLPELGPDVTQAKLLCLAGMNGRASGGTSFLENLPGIAVFSQSIAAEQSTDWYGTVRGRAGPALGCKDRISIYRLGDRDSTGDGPCGSKSSPCACILQCGLSRPLQRRSAWLELSLLV